jgi:processive 1,2-diacylglycerol beta-glucosyltransferase
LKVKGEISTKILTAFSDWHTQKFWIFPHVDKYLVATQRQKEDLARLGIHDKHVAVTGILLSDRFYQATSKQQARELLHLPQNVPIILVMGGGKGWGIERIIDELHNLSSPIEIIVVAANEIRKEEICRRLKSKSVDEAQFRITGFIEPSAYFYAADLLISKPGGLTTSQAFLVRLPVLPINPLPGQEDMNLAVLLDYKAVLSIGKRLDLAAQIKPLLTDRNCLERISSAASCLAPPNAREKVLDAIISVLAQT